MFARIKRTNDPLPKLLNKSIPISGWGPNGHPADYPVE